MINTSSNSNIRPTASIPGSNETSNQGLLTPSSNNEGGQPVVLSPASTSAATNACPSGPGNYPFCSSELLQENRASQKLHFNESWHKDYRQGHDAAKQQPLAENTMAQQEVSQGNSIPEKHPADKTVPTQAEPSLSSSPCKPASHSAIAQAGCLIPPAPGPPPFGFGKAELEIRENKTQAQATQLLLPHDHQLSVQRLGEVAAQIPAGNLKVSERQTTHEDHISLIKYGDRADEGASSVGSRWPRQETQALLQIRADMDAAFRNAIVKHPLWDEVSRKLAELGYERSAKKCKEKFENVSKYYKRTREGKAGRQGGKVYRFCSQLEALSSPSASTEPAPTKLLQPSSEAAQACFPDQVSLCHLAGSLPLDSAHTQLVSAIGDDADDDDENVINGDNGEEDTLSVPLPSVPFHESAHGLGAADRSKKRRRDGSTFLMAFFEELLRRVMDKQEEMQQRFLQVMEKRENERIIREEAWRSQEMARLNKEDELRVQERSSSAARDAAVIAFLQKISGQAVDLPAAVAVPAGAPILAQPVQSALPFLHDEKMFDHYKERKYFKMAKEGSNKRPEIVKACPSFHELDALNRKDSRVCTDGANVLSCNKKNGLMQNENIGPQPSTSNRESELDNRSCLRMEHVDARPEKMPVTDGSSNYIDSNHNNLCDAIVNKNSGERILQGTETMQHSFVTALDDSIMPSASDHIARRTGFQTNFGSCIQQEACSSGGSLCHRWPSFFQTVSCFQSHSCLSILCRPYESTFCMIRVSVMYAMLGKNTLQNILASQKITMLRGCSVLGGYLLPKQQFQVHILVVHLISSSIIVVLGRTFVLID